jgi:hypothetical protein
LKSRERHFSSLVGQGRQPPTLSARRHSDLMTWQRRSITTWPNEQATALCSVTRGIYLLLSLRSEKIKYKCVLIRYLSAYLSNLSFPSALTTSRFSIYLPGQILSQEPFARKKTRFKIGNVLHVLRWSSAYTPCWCYLS